MEYFLPLLQIIPVGWRINDASTLGIWADWQVTLVTLGFSLFMVFVMVYMIGRALQQEHLKAYAKSEMVSCLLTIFLVVFLFHSVQLAAMVGFNLTNPNNPIIDINDPRNTQVFNGQSGTTSSYLFDTLLADNTGTIPATINNLENFWDTIYDANYGYEGWTSFCFTIAGFKFWCINWSKSVYAAIEGKHFLSLKVGNMIIAANTLYQALQFIRLTALNYFLPTGIILRAFPPSRGLGGLLIAMSVCFFFLFPALLIALIQQAITISPDVIGMVSLDVSSLQCSPASGSVFSLENSGVLMEKAEEQAKEMIDWNNRAAAEVASIFITIVFYPFIALAITVIGIRTLASLLGGDANDVVRMVSKVI